MKITIGDFLLERLKAAGIHEIIGVPGDFNLQFLDQIEHMTNIQFVGTRNELNAAYAADGYARMNGIAALTVTYGVGELSAINGIAGAYAEHIPIVSITGAPPLYAMREGWQTHHTMADGNFNNMRMAFSQFTAAQAVITPENAAHEIDRVIQTALQLQRPVYLQIPSDVSYLEIEISSDATRPFSFGQSNPEQLAQAVKKISQLFSQASQPAALIDKDLDRYHANHELEKIIKQTGMPFASLTTGKAILSEQNKHYQGLYNGKNSQSEVKKIIENADFLLTFNPRFIETNSGEYTQSLPPNTVNVHGNYVNVAGQRFEGVLMRDLLQQLTSTLPLIYKRTPRAIVSQPAEFVSRNGVPLTQKRLWQQVASLFKPHDVILAEAGTANIGLSSLRFPADVKIISSNIWGAIGYTLPALFGSLLASPNRRQILFIGDGSFQLTAQELSTILEGKLKPIIFLLNNGGYTIERYIRGAQAKYNDIVPWDYQVLPKAFAPDSNVLVLDVRTEDQLAAALKKISSSNTAVFIELHLEALDAPQGLKQFGVEAAQFDYGQPNSDKNVE
ncbi:alpha-keto acid decarboxylase family protein [Lactiplantibacillus plantarum]|uniref:alpha-keto acid decarboxylase family protein n=1 Tax=Lactiplantibacillus plantarum TaxID=1590 RepID=UPI0021A65FA6|nr:thiamine pyrophosphate-binding protein [Lactiplantibacillus plantarum]MCT3212789.1 alpha-keto acid decarboxylase family protein [Lactiplantibacillus plantarum]MCT3271866.1 alpha-keto acid decarboxylase family protein [Lactiplantibacillus plantarum]